jgi:hypothetical protein
LNKHSKSGKKDGYWKIFLDEKLSPTDSLQSYFYGYDFYDNGKPIIVYRKDWWRKNYRHKFDSSLMKKGNPVLLNGTFTWYKDKDSLPAIIETYKEGQPLKLLSFHYCEFHIYGIEELVDYSKKYNKELGSYYFEIHDGFQSNIRKYWYRKEKGRWKRKRIEG